jgi:hypothetical protein
MPSSLKTVLINKITNWLTEDAQPPRDFPLSNFERILYEVRPCDVLLIEGRTRVSEVIRTITQSPWTHAVLYIGRLRDIENPVLYKQVEQHYLGDTGTQLIIESILGKGTIVSPLSDYQKDHIRICRPKGLSRYDALNVISYAIGKLGLQYDVRQIFDLARFLLPWTIFPRRWQSSLFSYNPGTSTKQSCSSLVAEAFSSVHFPILPVLKEQGGSMEILMRNPRLFTPSDFDFSPFFEIIKYPIFELSERGVYRDLPWNKQGLYSNDDGQVIHTSEMPPTQGTAIKEQTLEEKNSAYQSKSGASATETDFSKDSSTPSVPSSSVISSTSSIPLSPAPSNGSDAEKSDKKSRRKKFPSRIWDFFD